jgi:ADP-heptose:LPS heptosyltransferase
VISVDTSVAHLAGSLGKPVLLLLPWIADWRWLQDRDDSPWYPSFELLRQSRANDWSDVLAQLPAKIQQHLTE